MLRFALPALALTPLIGISPTSSPLQHPPVAPAADAAAIGTAERGSDPCEIFAGLRDSDRVWRGVRDPFEILERARQGGQRGSVTASIDGSQILQIIGTNSAESIRLMVDPSDSSLLRVQSPDDGSGQVWTFALSAFVRIHVALGADDDLVVFDDSNGSVEALKPFDLESGDGDDVIISRTGTLTLTQVLSLLNTVQTARDLMDQADAMILAAGAVQNLGTGSDMISQAIDLMEAAETNFVTPATTYLQDVQNQLILPAAQTAVDAHDQLIVGTQNLVGTANTQLGQPGLALKDDATNDLKLPGKALHNDAQGQLFTASNQVSGCAEAGLLNTDAVAFETRVRDLVDQIKALADLCPEKGPEPPEQPEICPEMQELIDCLEREIEEFEALGEICAEDADDLVDDADDFVIRAEAELVAVGDAYLTRLQNFETDADNFNTLAEAFETSSEQFVLNKEAQLEAAGAALEASGTTIFIQGGAAYEAQAQAQLQQAADQLTNAANQVIADAQLVLDAAADLLQDSVRGGGACSSIVTTNTLIGGPGANFLLGGSGNDRLQGFGGPDLLIGAGGDDILLGGDGIDLMLGGGGTNEIRGEGDIDILIGGNGVDCIFGEDDLDLIIGRGGADELDGGEYIDVILGGAANDSILGGDGIDILFGGDGNDSIDAGRCIDLVFGGDGDDTIVGGEGQVVTISSLSLDVGDVLFGGAGEDEIWGDADDGTGTGIDVIFGGDNDDTIDAANGGDFTVGSNFTFKLGNVVFGGDGNDEIDSRDGVDVLFGGAGNDGIRSRIGATLSLNSGNFTLAIGDLIFGGDGDDTIAGDQPTLTNDIDLLFGGDGNDTIIGIDGGDLVVNSFTMKIGNVMFGGAGDDLIYAKAGIDLIFCGPDNDTAEAGVGNLFSFSSGQYQIDFGDLMFGGIGNDILHGDLPGEPNDPVDDGIDLIFGQAGDDQIYSGTGGTIVIAGVDFQFGNLLFGGPDNDTITCDYQLLDPSDRKNGIDLVFGAAGDDTIDGGPGSRIWIGSVTTYFEFGNLLFGGPDNDNITGGDDIDLIFGGRGDDTIDALDDIDIVFGSQGEDTISAGDGGFILLPGPTPITFGNIVFGGAEADTIDSDGRVTEIDVLFGNKCDDIITAGDGLLDLVFGNRGNDEIYAEDGIDIVFGGKGDDIAINMGDGIFDLGFGGDGNDNMDGEDGFDLLFGGEGSDHIKGGDGVLDLIFGNRGGDLIEGGNGLDLLFGNRGGDVIYGDGPSSTSSGIDLIFGGDATDIIYGGGDIDILFGNSEPDVIYGEDGIDLIFGNGGDDEIYGGNGLDLLFGNSGNDMIFGDAGVDLLFGNSDNDCLFGNADSGVLFGNSGNDIVVGGGGTELAFGNSDADFLYGGGGVDLLFGNTGNDVIYGESGFDLLFGNKDNDDVSGDGDDDIMFGNKQNDRLNGGPSNDVIFGNNDNDSLYSGGSDGVRDYLFGNRGNDSLNGCESNDKLFGGKGSDSKNRDCNTISFAHANCASIRGTVFLDTDGNSTPDVGFPGVTVFLDLNNNGVNDGEPTRVTLSDDPDTYPNEAGTYRFDMLSAGSYVVRQVVPANYTQISPAGAHSFSLSRFEIRTGVNFVDQDTCPPSPAGDPPCPACNCPPGFVAQPVYDTVLVCSDTGRPCNTDDDCDCGGSCIPRQVLIDCECVPQQGCHLVEIPGQPPSCEGDCPTGNCTLVNTPTGPECDCQTGNNFSDRCFDAPVFGPGIYEGSTIGVGSDGPIICGGAVSFSPDVWFLTIPPATGIMTVSTCLGANFDTVMEVWNHCPGLGELLACDDNSCNNTRSVISIPVVAGSTYYVRIGGVGGSFGTFTLSLQFSAPVERPCDPPPATRGSSPPPNAPVIAPPPHDIRKNRYISFTPNNDGAQVAFEITVPPCRRGWISAPVFESFNGVDPGFVSTIVEEPVYRVWSEGVLHVRGCAIAPSREYSLRASTTDAVFSDPLTLETVAVWGDIVGPQAVGFGPPDGVVNQLDRQAIVAKINGSPFAPHATRVDLSPNYPDYDAEPDDVTVWNDAAVPNPYPPALFGILDISECDFDVPCDPNCGDIDGNGFVDIADLARLLSHFGTPIGATCREGDLDGDGDVDLQDLGLILSRFGFACS